MNQAENPDKGATRSRTPHSKEFLEYISTGWADNAPAKVAQDPVAPFANTRRQAVAAAFPGKVLVIEAGLQRLDRTTPSTATARTQPLLT